MSLRLANSPLAQPRLWISLAITAAVITFATGAGRAAAQATAKPDPGDAARGKAMYQKTCVTCHGDRAQGKREIGSPALHQQEAWYLAAQLHKFKVGARGSDPKDATGSIMRPMALGLADDRSIQDVAAFISSIQGPEPTPVVKGDVAAGRAHFTKVCAACHGTDARGNPAVKSPALLGQNDWYIVAQLKKFKQGQRGVDPRDVSGMQMKAMAATLATEQAVLDVAAYIATLK